MSECAQQRSASGAFLPPQLLVEPGSPHPPIPLHRARRNPEHIGRLFDRQAAERSQLDDLCLLRVDFAKPREQLVDGDHGQLAGRCILPCLFQRQRADATPPFARLMSARVIDQDASHQLRSNPEKVGAVVPVHLPLIDQLEVRLVDQRSRLQGVLGPNGRQRAARDPAQLSVNERHEPIARGCIAVTPVDQESRDVV